MIDRAGCIVLNGAWISCRRPVAGKLANALAWPGEGCVDSALSRQKLVEPLQQLASRARRRRFHGRGASVLRSRPRRQVFVHRPISELGHEVVAAARGDEQRYLGGGIAE